MDTATETVEFVGRPGIAFNIRTRYEDFGDATGTVVAGGFTAMLVKWSSNDVRGIVDPKARPGKWTLTTSDGRTFSGAFQG